MKNNSAIFFFCSSPFTTSSHTFVSSILHEFSVSTSKRYKRFLLWSLFQVFILLCKFPWTCKNSIKFVWFFSYKSVFVCLIFRPVYSLEVATWVHEISRYGGILHHWRERLNLDLLPLHPLRHKVLESQELFSAL